MYSKNKQGDQAAETAIKAKGFGCLTIFALPFLLVGLGMAGWIAKDAYQWWQVKSWQPVQATLLATELEVHHGDDSTTYLATARYTYRYNGVNYESTRVAITGGADNIGDFHQSLHAQLSRQQQAKQPVTAWVNPGNPAEALLNHQFRWGMVGFQLIFVVVFGGVAIGMIVGERYGRRKAAETTVLTDQHPNAPWLWRDDWASGEVRCNSKGIMVFVIIFAVMWNAISLPVLFAVPDAIRTQQYGILVALIFPLVGAGMGFWAWRLVQRYRRYGRSVLRLATIPFPPGGFIDAKLQLPQQVYDAQELQLTLDCMRRTTSGSGDDRRTSISSTWQRHFKLGRGDLLAAGADGLPIKLLLPDDARETTTTDGSDGFFWQLTTRAEMPGVDYSANFEVPVFTVQGVEGESQYRHVGEFGGFVDDGELRSTKPQFNQAGLLLPETVSDDQLAQSGITTGHDQQGWYLSFARCRNRSAALSTLFFTTIWLGATTAMWFFDSPQLFPIVFGLFGVIMLVVTLDLLFRHSTVRAHRGELLLHSGWFRRNERLVPIAEIKSIEAERGMQAGTRLYYRIRLHRHSQSTLTLASGVNGLHVAEQLIDKIVQRLGGKLAG